MKRRRLTHEQLIEEYQYYLREIQSGSSLKEVITKTETNEAGFYRRKAIVELSLAAPDTFMELSRTCKSQKELARYAVKELKTAEIAAKLLVLVMKGKAIGRDGNRDRWK